MKSGLLDQNGNLLECPYYEIENLCQKITHNYCSISEETQTIFSNFAKDYTYFSPYFDFVVGVLGYSLVNSWLRTGYLLCKMPEEKGYMVKYKISNEYMPYEKGRKQIGFSSDKDLKIKPFEQGPGNFYPCFVTEDLMELIPNVSGHRALAAQLLNLGMIRDKELCEQLKTIDLEHKDSAEVLMYFWPLVRFDDWDKPNECLVTYRGDNISLEQKQKMEALKPYYGLKNLDNDYALIDCHEVFDWSNKFYSEERREKNANQRL